MNEIKIADRYARALFDLALEKDMLEKIRTDIALVRKVCQENRDFINFLHSPVIKESKKIAVIRELFGKKVQEIMLGFMIIITRNRRESLLPVIARRFVEIYKTNKNIITVDLTTAVGISDEFRKRIVRLIEKATQSEVDLQYKIDESIIGGFVVTFMDKQYDASILRQIQNLRQEFNINLYIKGF